MDNLKRPAFAQPLTIGSSGDVLTPINQHDDFAGFTKLEYASLMIAQAYAANPSFVGNTDEYIAEISVKFAKAVLQEANK